MKAIQEPPARSEAPRANGAEFAHSEWATEAARREWEPRLQRIKQAWGEIEWRSVVAGIRRCTLKDVHPRRFSAQAAVYAREGLSALPIATSGAQSSSYSNAGVKARAGEPFQYRIAVGLPEDLALFHECWKTGDQEGVGELLGYPPCCRRFFRDVWVDRALRDTTWEMARNTRAQRGTSGAIDEVEVAGPVYANILGRWMGARCVPHLPCRFDCEPTAAVGERLVRLGRELGRAVEMDWLLELLDRPFTWTSERGVARIECDVMHVEASTDLVERKARVQRKGGSAVRTSASRASGPDWLWTDNGFASRAAMQQSHAPLLRVARAALHARGGDVLDLGCGNGALLAELVAKVPAARLHGVESDARRLAHASELLPAHASAFHHGDLFDCDGPWTAGRRFALALLMPGRLLEAGPERARRLRERIEASCDQLLVYAYGDWLTKHGDLAGLARRAGLRLLSPVDAIPASLAVFRPS